MTTALALGADIGHGLLILAAALVLGAVGGLIVRLRQSVRADAAQPPHPSGAECQCVLSGPLPALLDVVAGHVLLTCAQCGLPIDGELMGQVDTRRAVPVTVDWTAVHHARTDGWHLYGVVEPYMTGSVG